MSLRGAASMLGLVAVASCGGELQGGGDASADATVAHDGGIDAHPSDASSADGNDPDAVFASDGAACAACSSSLDAFCATQAGGCPPPLGSPNLYSWAQHFITPDLSPPVCLSFDACPEMVVLYFQYRHACINLPPGGEAFLFDSASKTLVGVVDTCDGFSMAHCDGANGCLPARCMPNESVVPNPAACPALPDGAADTADE